MADEETKDSGGEFALEMSLEGRGSFSAKGSGVLVLKALQQFREEVKSVAPVEKPPAVATTTTPPPTPAEGEAAPAAAATKTTLPLPVYLKEKAPKTNPQAIAVIAAHAKANGTAEFDIKKFTALWVASGRKAAGNLARDVDDAVKSGWLYRPARGQYVLTEYGEQFVAGLPAKKE